MEPLSPDHLRATEWKLGSCQDEPSDRFNPASVSPGAAVYDICQQADVLLRRAQQRLADIKAAVVGRHVTEAILAPLPAMERAS